MSQPSTAPKLTPSLCFNSTALRAKSRLKEDFLRISRSTIDDSITQNLNALITPSRDGFNPSSTSTRDIHPRGKTLVDPIKSAAFRNQVLFPSWQSRSDVLNYCAGVATSDDPDDPDLLLRQAESAKDAERIVNERLDPYSARFFPKEPRTEILASIIRNERAVEGIIRSRTWGLVGERCGDLGMGWEDALNHWRAERE
ncbi:hypothetical protein MMC25_005172 [Agyrium rufum]|nr:hypothetical protein [Agyrium rufum]